MKKEMLKIIDRTTDQTFILAPMICQEKSCRNPDRRNLGDIHVMQPVFFRTMRNSTLCGDNPSTENCLNIFSKMRQTAAAKVSDAYGGGERSS